MKRSHSYGSALDYSYSDKPISLAMIGAGRAGEFHVKSLSINKQFELKYIVDTDEDKANSLSGKVGCLFHHDIKWVLQHGDVQAVLICTTTPTHYALTIQCLENGKHVFCEKPLGKTEKEINHCFRLANSLNLKLLVAYQKRFDDNYSKLYEDIQRHKTEGHSPKHIHLITRDHPRPPLSYLKTSNGIVEDMMSHDIDIANLYMGFEVPESIVAFASTHSPVLQEIQEIEEIEILMKYSQGQLVTLTGSRDAKHGYDQRAEVYGDFGLYKLENQYDTTLQHHDPRGTNQGTINYSFSQRYQKAYLKELDYFYKMICHNYGPLVEENHLILTKKLCNAINDSIQTNEIIHVKDTLRTYHVDTPQYFLYRDMHVNQTLDYVKGMYNTYRSLNNHTMTMNDALSKLNTFVDPSDPDVDEDNATHAYQTAERARLLHPSNQELQVVALIHDLGKVLFTLGEPNWAIVGDTYAVGCEFPKSIVYYDTLRDNPDFNKYDKLGIYTKNCGLENVYITFGHDEYLYQVLHQNKEKHQISQKYMDVIRYHSFYPWHTEGEYRHLMNERDHQTLVDVNEFNQFDLYSKEDSPEISDEIKAYYDELLTRYFPEPLQW